MTATERIRNDMKSKNQSTTQGGSTLGARRCSRVRDESKERELYEQHRGLGEGDGVEMGAFENDLYGLPDGFSEHPFEDGNF